MRDPSRIPTHHGVFHFRERQYACIHARACTLVLNRHTRARSCVHLSTFVSIACEKRREKRSASPACRANPLRSQRPYSAVRTTVPFPFPFFVCEAVYFATRTYCRDYSIAPAVCTLRFHKIAFEARNNAASRKDLSLESPSRWFAIQNISQKEFEYINII